MINENNFNSLLENITNGNWSNAENNFKDLPFEMSPSEFVDSIAELDEKTISDIVLVGFYYMCENSSSSNNSIDNFNNLLENITNGNWCNAEDNFKSLPFEMSPTEFTERINELNKYTLCNLALVGFYCVYK